MGNVMFEGSEGTLVGAIHRSSTSAGTILLLHGGGQTRHSWRRTGDHLAEAGWTTLAYDARGHGDSDWAFDYSIDALADDLAKVVAQLDDVPVVVGASMGGLTALLGLGELKIPATSLVLVDITPQAEPAGVQRVLDFMGSAPDGFASLEDAADAIAQYNPHRPRPKSADGLRKNLRQRRADGRWYWHWDPRFLEFGPLHAELIRSERLRDAARAVDVPTMLVRGAYSDVVSDVGTTALSEAIPHLHMSDADAGHMVAGDDNTVFANGLLGFLNDEVRRPPLS
jgi:pimeloyl-ACP methyl ester carboxylesterase